MKRSILLSLLVIGAAVALIGGASVSLFHDSETTTGGLNTGSLNLQVGATEGGIENCQYVDPLPSPSFFVPNAKPGDVFEKTFCVRNDGTIDGVLGGSVSNVIDIEVGCNEPEAEAEGDLACTAGIPTPWDDGELSENLHLEIWRDLDCMNDFDEGIDLKLFDGTLEVLKGLPLPPDLMLAGEERCYALQGTVNGGNEVQTDQVTADIVFDLMQAP